MSFSVNESSRQRFLSALHEYRAVKKKSDEYVINKGLQNIAGWAAHATIQANRAQVAAELGARYRTYTPKGKTKKRTAMTVTPTTLAKARLAASYRRAGKPIPPEPEFSRRVRKMTRSILRSIGFMKAGFLPAFNKFKRLQAGADASAFGGRRQEGYGGAIPARPTGNGLTGELWNASVNRMDPGSWPALEQHAGRGLNRGLDLAASKFHEWITDEHNKAASKFNA